MQILKGFLAEGVNRDDGYGEIRTLIFRCPSGKKHTHSIPTTDYAAFTYPDGNIFAGIEIWHREMQNEILIISPSIDCSKSPEGVNITPCGFHDYYGFILTKKEDIFYGIYTTNN